MGRDIYRLPFPQPLKVDPQIFPLHSRDSFDGNMDEEGFFSRYLRAVGKRRHCQRAIENSSLDQISA
ncbi:UNVERIFIED_ORG: hypothetical protein GGD48_004289 [Rhizobium etli]